MPLLNETCAEDRPCAYEGSLCDINLNRCICALSFVYNHRSDSCVPACRGGQCDTTVSMDYQVWPISAFHIAAMFSACILVLAVCHLIIRLYMRQRETAFLRNHNRSYLESLVVRGRATSGGPEGPIIAGAAPNYDCDDLEIISRPPGYQEIAHTVHNV